jgi:hypothetical protein
VKVFDGLVDRTSTQLKEKVSEDELGRFERNVGESRNLRDRIVPDVEFTRPRSADQVAIGTKSDCQRIIDNYLRMVEVELAFHEPVGVRDVYHEVSHGRSSVIPVIADVVAEKFTPERITLSVYARCA